MPIRVRAVVSLGLCFVVLAPVASALFPLSTTFVYQMLDDGTVRFIGEPPETILDCEGGWLDGGRSALFIDIDGWSVEFLLRQSLDGRVSLTASTTRDSMVLRSTLVCPAPSLRAPDVVGETESRVPTFWTPATPPAPLPSPNPLGWHELTTNAQLAPHDTSRPIEGVPLYHCARARLVASAPVTSPFEPVSAQVPFTGRLSMALPEWRGTDVLAHRTGTYLAGVGPWDLTLAGAPADPFARATGSGAAVCQDGWWGGTADVRAEGIVALDAAALGSWQGFVQSCHAECP